MTVPVSNPNFIACYIRIINNYVHYLVPFRVRLKSTPHGGSKMEYYLGYIQYYNTYYIQSKLAKTIHDTAITPFARYF